MELNDVPPGQEIAVDANLLVYHFAGGSPQCSDFLCRVAPGRIRAWTGVQILAELTHRLMILEAQARGLLRGNNPARRLRRRPDIVRDLTGYAESVRAASVILADIVPRTLDVIERSAIVRKASGLLTNDSLLVAMMEIRGTTALATADSDFERIRGVQLYCPSDL